MLTLFIAVLGCLLLQGTLAANYVVPWGFSATGVVSVVRIGDSITWALTLDTADHTVSATPDLVTGIRTFDSDRLTKSSRFTFLFNTSTTCTYQCKIHSRLVGYVIVLNPPVTSIISWVLTSPDITTTINFGDAVTWVNDDPDIVHIVSSLRIDNSTKMPFFSSGEIAPLQSWTFVFDKQSSTGEFQYICDFHPQMKGTIIVLPAPTLATVTTSVTTLSATSTTTTVLVTATQPTAVSTVTSTSFTSPSSSTSATTTTTTTTTRSITSVTTTSTINVIPHATLFLFDASLTLFFSEPAALQALLSTYQSTTLTLTLSTEDSQLNLNISLPLSAAIADQYSLRVQLIDAEYDLLVSAIFNESFVSSGFSLSTELWGTIPLSFYCLNESSSELLSNSDFVDPDSSMCDSECGSPSELLSAYRHILCRLQCVLPDFTGSRLAKSCIDGAEAYFEAIDECVPVSVASEAEIYNAYQLEKTCSGGNVKTLAQLEGLRFCNRITDSLSIEIDDFQADFTALYDISKIDGYLLIRGSNLGSLDTFANLMTIGANGEAVEINGQLYSVAIIDNPNLYSLGNIPDIQMNAQRGTLVRNNSIICFDMSQQWAQRQDSYLEYDSKQCRDISCPAFESDSLCYSFCSSCGTLCEAFPISNFLSLLLYTTKQCTIIVGDLYVLNLPVDVTTELLFNNLRNVKTLRGNLYVKDNHITSLSFLSNIELITKDVYLVNNPQLVDARLPALKSIYGDLEVSGCERLCSYRYPQAGIFNDSISCANQTMDYFLFFNAAVTSAQLPIIDAVLTRLMSSLTRKSWTGESRSILIEGGDDWAHVKTVIMNIDPRTYIIARFRDAIDSGSFRAFVLSANERSFFDVHGVSTLAPPELVADAAGYNSGNRLLAATPLLNGVLLQWSHLFAPYTLNFAQYRVTENLTAALTPTDFPAPYETLPSVFQSAHSYQFLVPRDVLVDGQYFEFRLAFPFVTHTYYSNTLVVRTFDLNSPFVSSIESKVTNSSISLSWNPPEYSAGIIGYEAALRFSSARRVAVKSNSSIIALVPRTLAQPFVTFGCLSNESSGCLLPFTNYVVDISVIREYNKDEAKSYSFQTKEAAPKFSPFVVLQNVSYNSVTLCTSNSSSHFGPITQLETKFTVISTINDAVIPENGTDIVKTSPSQLSTGECFSHIIHMLIPLTRYSFQTRAWTVAGPGPYSDPVFTDTPSLQTGNIHAPEIRPLLPSELRELGWSSGYRVTLQAPDGVHESDIVRFELYDVGLLDSKSLVYFGRDSAVSIQTIALSLRVRIITIGGVGDFSAGAQPSSFSSSSTSSDKIIIIVVVIAGVIILALLAIVGKRYYRNYKLYQDQLADVKRRIPPSVLAVLEKMNHGKFNVPKAINLVHLTFLDTLGEGKFGAVMKAMLDEQERTGVPGYLVAVKMAKEEASLDQVEEMRLEAALMAQFTHPNVIGLIGQVSDGDMLLLIVQYCENGSLLSWLTQHSSSPNLQTLLSMCIEIASGMSYLSILGVVHRDLAARNVLVSSDHTCKVSDFGLSRHSEDGIVSTTSKDTVAIRWAAPEAIADHMYTSKSDVWSFGVLMFEVFSLGQKPYGAWKNVRVMEELRKGYRLEKPTLCSDEVYNLMTLTWHADPDARPDFESLETSLISLVPEYSEKTVQTNKLVERFNSRKQQAIALSKDRIPNQHHPDKHHSISASKQRARNTSSSSQDSTPDRNHPHHSLEKNHSYTVLIGKDGTEIPVDKRFEQPPPAFVKPVEEVKTVVSLPSDDAVLPSLLSRPSPQTSGSVTPTGEGMRLGLDLRRVSIPRRSPRLSTISAVGISRNASETTSLNQMDALLAVILDATPSVPEIVKKASEALEANSSESAVCLPLPTVPMKDSVRKEPSVQTTEDTEDENESLAPKDGVLEANVQFISEETVV